MELHNVQFKKMATIRGLKIQLKDGRKCSIKTIYHQVVTANLPNIIHNYLYMQVIFIRMFLSSQMSNEYYLQVD